jgi:ferrous iron transport protein A
MTLWTLTRDTPGEIGALRLRGGARRRLMELGFTEGETVRKMLQGRGIAAYLVRGALIALRQADAEQVSVRT